MPGNQPGNQSTGYQNETRNPLKIKELSALKLVTKIFSKHATTFLMNFSRGIINCIHAREYMVTLVTMVT